MLFSTAVKLASGGGRSGPGCSRIVSLNHLRGIVAEWPSTLDVDALAADGWRPTPLTEFVLKIHSRCNLSCRYCYIYQMEDDSWRSRPKRIARRTVDWVAARIAEHAENHSLDAVHVVLHGGEPLLAGGELIEYAVKKIRSSTDARVGFDIQTNGVLLDTAYLKLFDSLDIHVAISLDGDANSHDRYRRRANGEGSHAAVVRSLEMLTTDPFRHLFEGLLCIIDPRNEPLETYEALLRFEPPEIDFLLPHGNWTSPPPARIPGSRETPYANWLIRVFDQWYRAPMQETRIRLFAELLKLLLGRSSATELVGLSPIGAVVIETDGSIDQSDILKSAYPGAPATGLHVDRDSFDSVLSLPSFAARQIGIRALCDECLDCEIHRVCGGGMYAHRYRAGHGFANPSVYCNELFRLISHIGNAVRNDVTSIRERQP